MTTNYVKGVETAEECRRRWEALPLPVEGESYKEWRALYQLAKRRGWELPERRRGRPPLGSKRACPTFEEWLAEWRSLPVPIGWENQARYQRLRRIGLRMGYELERRPNPAHDDRERDFMGRLKPIY